MHCRSTILSAMLPDLHLIATSMLHKSETKFWLLTHQDADTKENVVDELRHILQRLQDCHLVLGSSNGWW